MNQKNSMFQNEVFPLQDIFDMTAKPVRDLFYPKSKARLVVPARTDSIREIEISNPDFEKMKLPVDMKELKVLNDRTDDQTRLESFAAGENDSSTHKTSQLTVASTG